MSTKNREAWLQTAIEILRSGPSGANIPTHTHVSVGFPFGRDQRRAYGLNLTESRETHLFINPVIQSATPALAAISDAFGLNLKDMPADILTSILDLLGDYPNPAAAIPLKPAQSTRMLKLVCPICHAVIRMTQRWIKKSGVPACGCIPSGRPLFVREKPLSDSDALPF